MKSLLQILSLACFILGLIVLYSTFIKLNPIPPTPSPDPRYDRLITIDGTKVKTEIADTQEKMTKGLSGRPELLDGYGMLFVYQTPQVVTFWMPDMYFPIDMIFLKNNQVVYIETDVPNPPLDTPKQELKRYTPPEPVDMVLEVPSGFSQKHQIQVGSVLEYVN